MFKSTVWTSLSVSRVPRNIHTSSMITFVGFAEYSVKVSFVKIIFYKVLLKCKM